MRKSDRVLAILVSDVHLSLRPPIARAEEPDWFKAMERPWNEIRELQQKWKCPILCAGDLFDKWNSPVELVNWAIDHLPQMYAIPGNHDLPAHRHEGEHRSAYGCLVRAGLIIDLKRTPIYHGEMKIYGFPFGTEVEPPLKEEGIHIALIHEYMWTANCGYPGAPKEQKITKKTKRFQGYDVIVVGDNHIQFTLKLPGGTILWNCGTPIRRKANEAHYIPQVGLVLEDGSVKSHELDRSQDIITVLEHEEQGTHNPALDDFLQELAGLQSANLDFRDTMIAALASTKASPLVREVILEAMDG